MAEHRQRLDTYLAELIKSKKSPVLTDERQEAVIHHLRHPAEKVDPHFKHWVKERKFQIVDLPGLGLKDVLVVPRKEKKTSSGPSGSNFLRVIPSSKMFDVTHQVHVEEQLHSGYKKVLNYLQEHYYGVTRGYVQTFCKTCPTCQLKQPQTTKPPLRPIVEGDFLHRIQMDLIDLRHSPDRGFHYIAHVMDHFTKFHVLFPLKTKSASEVAEMMEERVLGYLGAPRIFHSDNGREFVNQVVRALLKTWSKDVTFVSGMPRKSQTQGLVERGNRVVENKIAAIKAERGLAGCVCVGSEEGWECAKCSN